MGNNIHEKIQELFVSYSQNLPNKLQNIQNHWQELCENYTAKLFEDFYREVHSLTGSAGTYGYHELSKSARELESYLKTFLGAKVITTEKQIAISKLIKALLATELRTDKIIYPDDLTSEMNHLIYVLDQDSSFVSELRKEFNDAGFQLRRLNNFPELITLVQKKQLPLALIVDVEYLDMHNTEQLLSLEKEKDIVIPLFCTAARGDIATRLRATRAGSVAFAQKPADAFYLTKVVAQITGPASSDPFKILVIDDSRSLAEYYALILQDAGMVTKILTNPLDTLDAVIDFGPDLLLLDIYMPECSGIELASILRQEPKFMHIPIIFLSAEEDKFKQLSALSFGGDDFLTKPILPQHLVASVKSRAKRAGIISSFMMRDSLTGLLNHTNILHQLDLEILRAKHHNLPLTFAMIDLDHFKLVNDEYGHIMGDRVLKKLSELFITRLRKTDYVGRYGGEEFAIILPDTEAMQGKRLLDELREKFFQTKFDTNGTSFNVAFSGGIVSLQKNQTADQLIEAADQALYKAKLEGRNQVQLGDE